MNLNELCETGAALEVTFYDAEFEEEDGQDGAESRDDFVMLLLGPHRLPSCKCSAICWCKTW